MQTTMNLLERALKIQPYKYWTQRLNLSRGALHSGKTRGHLSPAIAGALAEEMGESPRDWMVIAALESEKNSACKTRMIERFRHLAAIFVVAVPLSEQTPFDLFGSVSEIRSSLSIG